MIFTFDLFSAMHEVGGFTSLLDKYSVAVASSQSDRVPRDPLSPGKCMDVPPDFMHLFRSAYDDDLPWPGVVFGLSLSALWFEI